MRSSNLCGGVEGGRDELTVLWDTNMLGALKRGNDLLVGVMRSYAHVCVLCVCFVRSRMKE